MNDASKNRTGFVHSLFRLLDIGAFLSLFALLSLGQVTRELTVEKPKVSDKRTALVIGNGNYQIARKLTNPVNDATDMAAALKELGFDVISGTDLTLKQMREKVREFGDKLKANGGVGLFYYAGHGIQVNGTNYLIPVETDIPREDEIESLAYSLDNLFGKLSTANNGFNIVILDACRNNPFAQSWNRGLDTGGLAQVSAPTGTFIAYATDVNKSASDGAGRNGLYTSWLLKVIPTQNLKLQDVFNEVTKGVRTSSNGRQTPWTASSFYGDFYFQKLTKEAMAARESREKEQRAWRFVQNSSRPLDFREFLKEFPNGDNALAARSKLDGVIWELVDEKRDLVSVEGYLAEFSDGLNTFQARVLLRRLKSPSLGELSDLLTFNDIKAAIDNIYIRLNMSPGAQGYIVNYGIAEEVKRRKEQIEKAIAFRKYDRDLILFVDGPERNGGLSTKFIVVPTREPNPP